MKRILLVLIGILVGTLYIGFILYNYLYWHRIEYLGNTQENVMRLKEKDSKETFSFGFMSDMENSDAGLWLLREMLKEDIDFLILIGDIVNNPLFCEHKLFIDNIRRLKPRIPIFIIPSNHDVDFEGDGGFNPVDFIKLYGSINFSFTYNNCLFIFISNVGEPEQGKYYDWLKHTLSGVGSVRFKFLFSTTSLRKIRDKVYCEVRGRSRFEELLKENKIDFVISGDYHRHVEFLGDNGVNYIISGSGGAHPHGDKQFGSFRNATKVTVYPDGIMREMLVCNRNVIFTDNSIRRFLYRWFERVLRRGA